MGKYRLDYGTLMQINRLENGLKRILDVRRAPAAKAWEPRAASAPPRWPRSGMAFAARQQSNFRGKRNEILGDIGLKRQPGPVHPCLASVPLFCLPCALQFYSHHSNQLFNCALYPGSHAGENITLKCCVYLGSLPCDGFSDSPSFGWPCQFWGVLVKHVVDCSLWEFDAVLVCLRSWVWGRKIVQVKCFITLSGVPGVFQCWAWLWSPPWLRCVLCLSGVATEELLYCLGVQAVLSGRRSVHAAHS